MSRRFRFPEGSVRNFAESGSTSIDGAMPDESFEIIVSACNRVLNNHLFPFTRKVSDPKWHNVEKVTLFRNPKGLLQKTHSEQTLAPELLAASQWSDEIVRSLGNGLLLLGSRRGSSILMESQHNRAIVNRMKGKKNEPAEIGIHTDPPSEHGANASLTLSSGVDIASGKIVEANRLTLYGCQDVCESLGISQQPHGFTSEETRLSLVFTSFEV